MSVYLLAGLRTPQAAFLGPFSNLLPSDLAGTTVKGLIEQTKIDPSKVDEAFFGHVVQAGCGQAPARQAALSGGLPESVRCSTINKVCGSGLEAIIQGARSIMVGDNDLVISGGMENMSGAPHLLPNSRTGTKFGPSNMKDSMQWDGLWDVYSDRPMGNCAEECAKEFKLSREEQDQFSIESFNRARKAWEEGVFQSEVVPVTIKTRKGEQVIEKDDGPFQVNFEKIPKLRPAFSKDGTITAANASSINDGAASVMLGSEQFKDQAKFKIVGFAGHAQNPTWFTTAPIEAMKKCLDKTSMNIKDIDLFEINEAFGLVTMACMKQLELDHSKVNIYGGGVSLGHPIGCSGARIIVTLMTAMKNKKAKYGMASICIGGGEALAMIIEQI